MRFTAILILMLSYLLLHSQESWRIDPELAGKVAISAFTEALSRSAIEPEAGFNSSITLDGNLYLVEFKNPSGIVIVSADLRAWPVPSYSVGPVPKSRDDFPPAFRWLLKTYQDEIENLKGDQPKQVEIEWERLSSGSSSKGSPPLGVSPMLQTTWGQGCNYNTFCPIDSAASGYYCYHVPAGCVATAMTQIFKYWEYPVHGSGSHSYLHSQYGTLVANYAGSTYDWSLMPLNASTTAPEIAELVFHLGVGVNMAYGPVSSGSYASDARGAIVNYFNYDPGAVYLQKISYTDQAWHALLRAELDNGRPIFYGGLDPNGYGGHAWVIDGYQSTYYHVNWGWDGSLNGYFMLTALNPQGSANFTNFHEAIMGIRPAAPPLKALFINDKTQLNSGDTIAFQDVSLGNPNTWQWSFPGGLPSSSSNQVPGPVTYSSPGIYDVTLVVGNGTSTDTLLKAGLIKVLPLANFRASSEKTETGGMIDFYDLSESLEPVVSWQWLFQGGQPATSPAKNPVGIKYTAAGTYSVALTIQTSAGQHTISVPSYIKVYSQCDTMMECKVDVPCFVQASDTANFQVGNFDLDQKVPYYASLGHSSDWIRFHDVISPGDTNFFYGATSWFVPAGKADNWLIFGPVTIPAGGATFQWSHLYWLNNKRDGYEVLISTDGGYPASTFDQPLAAFLDNDPGTEGDTIWVPWEVNLNASIYGGQSAYIAFHHYGNSMSYLFLDDFRIINCSGLPSIGFNEGSPEGTLLIFPNPATDRVELQFPAQANPVRIKIYSITGLLLKECIPEPGSSQHTLNLDGLPGGIYLIDMESPEKHLRSKLILY